MALLDVSTQISAFANLKLADRAPPRSAADYNRGYLFNHCIFNGAEKSGCRMG
jgi:hypothetical protein